MKASNLPEYDVAEALTTQKVQAEYLSVVLEHGDIQEIRQALRAVIRAREMGDKPGRAGFDGQDLYAALDDGNTLTLSTVMAVMGSLGMRLKAKRIGS